MLHEEIARLPEKYRVPVLLCELGGFSHREAACRLRWPTGSVSVRLMRAREMLRRRLVRRGLAPGVALLATASLSEAASAVVSRRLFAVTVRGASRFRPAAPAVTLSASTALAYLSWFAPVLAIAAVSLVLIFGASSDSPRLATVVDWPLGVPEPIARDLGTPSLPAGDRPVAGRTRIASVVNEDPPEARELGSAADRQLHGYQALVKKAGRSADAQFSLALWCESHGLVPERLKHLALAVLTDPAHAGARGLLGQVEYAGRWRRPEDVEVLVRADSGLSASLAAYEARRRRAADTADAQWKLAQWCELRGLKAEATAHLVSVTRLEPEHEAAWKRLGCKRYNGRWLSEDRAAAERTEDIAQREADKRWKTRLSRWRSWLNDADRRGEAERSLAEVSDPRAVPSVWFVFGSGGQTEQMRALQILGRIDTPASTWALGVLAAASPSPNVRRAACETLSRRDARVALDLLVGLLRDPDPNPGTVVYRFRYVATGALGVGSPGFTFLEGRGANFLRTYTVDESRNWATPDPPAMLPIYDYERRVMEQREIQSRELEEAVRRLIAEAFQEVYPVSASIRQVNARVTQALGNITGGNRFSGWEGWKKWWVEEMGYAYESEQFRNPPDLSFYEPKPTYVTSFHLSCFAAGTPVATLTGPRPIESIRSGDQVLTQDTRTGGLRFAPVLSVHHNKPAPTLRRKTSWRIFRRWIPSSAKKRKRRWWRS